MRYLIYDIKTGKAEKSISCPPELIYIQYDNTTQNFIESDEQSNAVFIESNKIVPIPPKPSEYCVFDYTTKTWIDPRTPETQWPIVRQQRDKLLQASDYTQLPDVPLTDKTAWATYRQELRDITNQPDPFNIIWPTPPQG